MPTPPLSDLKAQEAADAFTKAIKAGYRYPGSPSAITAAAKAVGISEKTMNGRIRIAAARGLIDLVDTDQKISVEIKPILKPRVIVRATSTTRPDTDAVRLVVIGDTHQAPGMSVDRWRWFARHVNAVSEQGGLSWGICEATVQAGHIIRHEFIDMVEMERRYA